MKSIYKNFFMLMVPMAFKELIAAFINLLDTVMLGGFGEDVIAAVGIANQWFFIFSVVIFGVCGGAGVFASQYWGAQNFEGMRKVLGLNVGIAVITSFLFSSVTVFFPEVIIKVFRKDPAVVEYGVSYLRIVGFSYLFSALTSAYDISLCCSEKAGLSFVSRLLGLVVNLVANQILIFGMFGLEAMGVEGAAVATIVARACELLFMLLVIYGKKYIQAAKLKDFLSVPKDILGGYLKASLPIILNEGAWVLGTTIYSWVYSQISTQATVIMVIVSNIERLLLVFFKGGGNATGIIVGNLIGNNEYKKAYEVSKKLCFATFFFAVIISSLFIWMRPLALIPYDVSPEIVDDTMTILFLLAILLNIKALTFLFIVGIFRNGGDPKMAAAIDVCSVWLVGVPCVLISGLLLKLPITQIYMVMMIEEFVKLIFSIWRFRSKKWIRNLVAETN